MPTSIFDRHPLPWTLTAEHVTEAEARVEAEETARTYEEQTGEAVGADCFAAMVLADPVYALRDANGVPVTHAFEDAGHVLLRGTLVAGGLDNPRVAPGAAEAALSLGACALALLTLSTIPGGVALHVTDRVDRLAGRVREIAERS